MFKICSCRLCVHEWLQIITVHLKHSYISQRFNIGQQYFIRSVGYSSNLIMIHVLGFVNGISWNWKKNSNLKLCKYYCCFMTKLLCKLYYSLQICYFQRCVWEDSGYNNYWIHILCIQKSQNSRLLSIRVRSLCVGLLNIFQVTEIHS